MLFLADCLLLLFVGAIYPLSIVVLLAEARVVLDPPACLIRFEFYFFFVDAFAASAI